MTSKPRPCDPLRLDVERFAQDGARLQGQWALAGMPRLAESCHPEAAPQADDRVAWQARGEMRRAGGESQTWLWLSLRASLRLTCQRCLGPVEIPLSVESWFRFVAGEAQAAALDAELDEDVLASTRSLNLHQLAEDELLLALPLVPRHEVCPVPLRASAHGPVTGADTVPEPHPFAALAGLKKTRH